MRGYKFLSITWPQAPDWRSWRHATKLDPDRTISAETLDAVYASGTDAVIVGGSTGITADAVARLLTRLADSPIPVALEVSSPEAAMPGASLFLVPLVMNTPDAHWLTGAQAGALARLLPQYGAIIPWHLLVPEAYLVLNPECAAARITRARTGLRATEAAAYAALAGRLLRLPLLYVEYSGSFGDMDLLKAVKAEAGTAHLVYGGGISGSEQAARAGAIADTVVVGNLVYSDPAQLRETVSAVRP